MTTGAAIEALQAAEYQVRRHPRQRCWRPADAEPGQWTAAQSFLVDPAIAYL